MGAILGACATVAGLHVMWILDTGEIKTGSSTAGLLFIFTPFYAVFAGTLGALLGAGIGRARGRPDRSPKQTP